MVNMDSHIHTEHAHKHHGQIQAVPTGLPIGGAASTRRPLHRPQAAGFGKKKVRRHWTRIRVLDTPKRNAQTGGEIANEFLLKSTPFHLTPSIIHIDQRNRKGISPSSSSNRHSLLIPSHLAHHHRLPLTTFSIAGSGGPHSVGISAT